MLYDVFIDTLLYGATGYITNKYVIDMLFKEYSLFNKVKCGGKIINSRMQFVKNVSIMMEKDIINAQKISEKFKTHNFNEEFRNFSKDFFDECICRDVKSLRLKDIPVFYDACCSVRDIAVNLLDINMGDILQNLGGDINLSRLITQKQIEHISQNIIQDIILVIQNTEIISNIVAESFDAFCDVKVSDIISKNISEKIKNNIQKEAVNFGSIIKENFDESIDTALNEILYQNGISNILNQIQESILQKPLKTFIKPASEDIAKYSHESIIEFLNSEKAEKALSNMYYDLKEYIVSTNASFFNIYKKDYEKIIKNHIKSRVNNVAYSVLKWVENNNDDLNAAIKESIDEIIPENPELRAKIFSTIKDYYSSRKKDDSLIIDILLKFESNNENLDKISSFIVAETENYLKSKNVRTIINALEDKKIINADVLINSIIKYIKYSSQNMLSGFIDNILSKNIGEYIDLDLVKIFNDKLKYIFIDYIKINTFYSEEIHIDLTKEVSEFIFESLDNKISELTDKKYALDKADDIKRLLIKNINNNVNRLTAKVGNIINNFVSKNNISDLLDKLSETNQSFDIRANEKISELISKNFSQLVDDIGDIRVSKILSKISSIPDIHDSLSDFMKNIVGESIAVVTEGYISETVERHFDEFTDTEFTDYIKTSTLINPQKINISGGLIGAAAGLSLSLASMNILSSSVISNVFSWQGIVLGSIIGLSTNFIAMNSFSTACSKNGILAKIPILKHFTENFIKQKQSIFADYMSEIVKGDLIDERTIQDLVQSKSTQLKHNINNTITNDGYKPIYEFLKNNNEYISSNLSLLTKNTLTKNTGTIASHISKSISDIPIKHLLNRNAIDSLMDVISTKKDEIVNISFDYIRQYLGENLSVLDFASKEMSDQIKEEIILSIDDQFGKITEFIKDIKNFKRYFSRYNKSYDDFLTQTLIDTIPLNSLDNIYFNLFDSLYSYAFTEDKINELCSKIYESLNNEFNINTNLDEVLGRKNKVLLNGMFYKYFKDIIIELQAYLSQNRHTKIETDIREKLLRSLNLKERASYNAVGADKIIFDIVNNLILIKIPGLFDRTFEQFYEISKGLSDDILNINIENLGICIDRDKLDGLVKELFIKDTGAPIIKNKAFLIFNLYMQKYNDTKIKKFAEHMYLDNINNIFARYETEISFVLKQLYNNTKKNKNTALKESIRIIGQSSHKILDSVLLKRLFDKINQDDIIKIEDIIKEIIEKNDLVYLNIKSIINSFYNYLEDMDLMDSVIDINDINSSLEEFIKKAAEDKSFDTFVQSLYSKIISNDLKFSTYMNMTKNVKKYLTELLVDGFYIAIRKNLNEIFQSIDLDDITKEEIMNLPSQKYQAIYKIFWKNNLKNAIWTGLAGGIITANKFGGIALALLETAKNTASKIKKIKENIILRIIKRKDR